MKTKYNKVPETETKEGFRGWEGVEKIDGCRKLGIEASSLLFLSEVCLLLKATELARESSRSIVPEAKDSKKIN